MYNKKSVKKGEPFVTVGMQRTARACGSRVAAAGRVSLAAIRSARHLRASENWSRCCRRPAFVVCRLSSLLSWRASRQPSACRMLLQPTFKKVERALCDAAIAQQRCKSRGPSAFDLTPRERDNENNALNRRNFVLLAFFRESGVRGVGDAIRASQALVSTRASHSLLFETMDEAFLLALTSSSQRNKE
jgi:hypothetical protein